MPVFLQTPLQNQMHTGAAAIQNAVTPKIIWKLYWFWLMSLGVGEKAATEDSCKMKHDMSKKSFEAIKRHINGWLPHMLKIRMD